MYGILVQRCRRRDRWLCLLLGALGAWHAPRSLFAVSRGVLTARHAAARDIVEPGPQWGLTAEEEEDFDDGVPEEFYAEAETFASFEDEDETNADLVEEPEEQEVLTVDPENGVASLAQEIVDFVKSDQKATLLVERPMHVLHAMKAVALADGMLHDTSQLGEEKALAFSTRQREEVEDGRFLIDWILTIVIVRKPEGEEWPVDRCWGIVCPRYKFTAEAELKAVQLAQKTTRAFEDEGRVELLVDEESWRAYGPMQNVLMAVRMFAAANTIWSTKLLGRPPTKAEYKPVFGAIVSNAEFPGANGEVSPRLRLTFVQISTFVDVKLLPDQVIVNRAESVGSIAREIARCTKVFGRADLCPIGERSALLSRALKATAFANEKLWEAYPDKVLAILPNVTKAYGSCVKNINLRVGLIDKPSAVDKAVAELAEEAQLHSTSDPQKMGKFASAITARLEELGHMTVFLKLGEGERDVMNMMKVSILLSAMSLASKFFFDKFYQGTAPKDVVKPVHAAIPMFAGDDRRVARLTLVQLPTSHPLIKDM